MLQARIAMPEKKHGVYWMEMAGGSLRRIATKMNRGQVLGERNNAALLKYANRKSPFAKLIAAACRARGRWISYRYDFTLDARMLARSLLEGDKFYDSLSAYSKQKAQAALDLEIDNELQSKFPSSLSAVKPGKKEYSPQGNIIDFVRAGFEAIASVLALRAREISADLSLRSKQDAPQGSTGLGMGGAALD